MSNKSEATWHPNSGPEVPHADLIAELRESADGLEYLSDSPWVRVMLNHAADALAALGDTVPASTLGKVVTSYEEALREARAERDALAHVIEHAREWMRTTPATQLDNPRWLELDGILDTAPAVSLALHDAEVWDEGYKASISDHDSPRVGMTVNPYRAAAIREKAK